MLAEGSFPVRLDLNDIAKELVLAGTWQRVPGEATTTVLKRARLIIFLWKMLNPRYLTSDLEGRKTLVSAGQGMNSLDVISDAL